MEMMLPALAGIGGLALALAVLIYGISRIFHVEEDERVKGVEGLLPGVNCGACGFAGCQGLAKAVVAAVDTGSMEGLFCPPGGQDTMDRIAALVGLSPVQGVRKVAVLRCGGDCTASPGKVTFQGAPNCLVAHGMFAGEGGCSFGCLGFGDCVTSCTFGAMTMDPRTGLPVIDPEICTACGACVKACPRQLIFLRSWGNEGRRVWVNCRNTERGAVARKNCSSACIACSKCVKVCDSIAKAITVENNVASIDPGLCTSCGACVPSCPTGAILSNLPVPSGSGDREGDQKQ